MYTIKQLFEGIKDKDLIHHKFVRFGKGSYERFFITIKNGKNLRVKSSYDWSNDLFGIIAERIQDESEISGKIIDFHDFEKDLPCKASSFGKRGKVYTADLKDIVSPETLRMIYEKFKTSFLLVNIKSSRYQLKCGKSLPKPGKALKDNFCSATLPAEALGEIAFGIDPKFKEAKIKHVMNIIDIKIPDEYKNDPAKARLNATRKGTITRITEVDGKTSETKTEFEA